MLMAQVCLTDHRHTRVSRPHGQVALWMPPGSLEEGVPVPGPGPAPLDVVGHPVGKAPYPETPSEQQGCSWPLDSRKPSVCSNAEAFYLGLLNHREHYWLLIKQCSRAVDHKK